MNTEIETMKLPGVLVHRKPKGETVPGAQAARQAHTSLAVAAADELVDLFSDAVNKSFKADISDALHHERVAKLLLDVDLEAQLSVENCHRVFKRCYGFKTWLYAPEDGSYLLVRLPIRPACAPSHRRHARRCARAFDARRLTYPLLVGSPGIRGMIREGITAYYAPLQSILKDVHQLTVSAFVISLEEAKILQAPGNESLKQLMEEQALESIEAWRRSTWQQLSANLHAEHEFPAPERFRSLKASIDRLLEHEANVQAERLVEHYRNMIDVAMKRMSVSDMRKRELASHALPASAVGAVGSKAMLPTPVGAFYMGWLEKKNRFGGY